MIAYFKTNSPVNVFLLFAYALILKWYSFLHPHVPVPQPTDGFLYLRLLNFLSPAGQSAPVIYPFIVLVLTLTQAISFNNLINNEKLLPAQLFTGNGIYSYYLAFLNGGSCRLRGH